MYCDHNLNNKISASENPMTVPFQQQMEKLYLSAFL